MNYKEVEGVLIQNGFTLERQTGSHRQYTATINGQRQVVTLFYHRKKDDVPSGTQGQSFASLNWKRNYSEKVDTED